MHGVGLLLTISVALSAALALGLLTQRLRLSPIVDYLLAGKCHGSWSDRNELDEVECRNNAARDRDDNRCPPVDELEHEYAGAQFHLPKNRRF